MRLCGKSPFVWFLLEMQATKQGVFNAIHNPKEVFNNLMIEHEQAGNAIATCYCTET